MSFWTDIRDQTEATLFGPFKGDSARKVKTGLGGLENRAEDAAGGFANRVLNRPSAAEKRSQAGMVRDQINAYKAQTELTEKEINNAQQEKAVQKRAVNEKQIRALRNNYRPSGGLLNGQGGAQPSNDLTNGAGLSTKLGNT